MKNYTISSINKNITTLQDVLVLLLIKNKKVFNALKNTGKNMQKQIKNILQGTFRIAEYF